jgi:hypothetical protein
MTNMIAKGMRPESTYKAGILKARYHLVRQSLGRRRCRGRLRRSHGGENWSSCARRLLVVDVVQERRRDGLVEVVSCLDGEGTLLA